MNFNNFIVVLGAGASKGAMLEEKETPPLDDELLPRAKHLFGKKGLKGNGKKAWMNFINHMGTIGLKSSEVVKYQEWGKKRDPHECLRQECFDVRAERS